MYFKVQFKTVKARQNRQLLDIRPSHSRLTSGEIGAKRVPNLYLEKVDFSRCLERNWRTCGATPKHLLLRRPQG